MHLYLIFYILLLMLRRLPSTLGFIAVRGIRPTKLQFRSFSTVETSNTVDLDADRARLIVSKLNLALNKRSRAGKKEEKVRVPVANPRQGDTTGIETVDASKVDSINFARLGLCDEIVKGLNAQGITIPTPVQDKVITRILSGENLVMAASTGSGKTLAYTLPCIQELHAQEQAGYMRRPKRPRVLVLVPTRELARQVLDSVKMIGHYSKVASTAVLGGEQYGMQKIQLDRLVDVVVASPGRLMQHKLQGNVYFSQVRHVIIDEVDTMLTQGFGPDIRAILRSVVSNRILHAPDNNTATSAAAATMAVEPAEEEEDTEAGTGDLAGRPAPLRKQPREEVKPAQVVMATATLTRAVKSLLDDVKGGFNLEFSDPSNPTPRVAREEDQRIKINVVEVDGVHRSLPNVQHVFEEAARDKIVTLRDVLARHRSKNMRTLIFCNTVQSCHAVEYAINQDTTAGGSFGGDDTEIHATSYHGDLNSAERAKNLERFRSGEERYMVCSDIAARGLDIPETGHVVMFDFPLNPVDYLHRAGRCGRAGRKGLVTALVAKRDIVLAEAIEEAISKGLPIDALSSDKKDYTGTGRLAKALRLPRKAESPDERERRQERLHYNIVRSKATKIKGEAAAKAAVAKASSASADGDSDGGKPRRHGHGSIFGSGDGGGRSGARLRNAVTPDRDGRSFTRNTARGVTRSSRRGIARGYIPSPGGAGETSERFSARSPTRFEKRPSREGKERGKGGEGRSKSAGRGREPERGASSSRGGARSSSAGRGGPAKSRDGSRSKR